MEECSVCLESMGGERIDTDCGHSFCKECLDRWFDGGNTSCPLCRAEIKYIIIGGETVRLLIKKTKRDEPPTDMITFERYYLLARWVLFQWFIIMVLGVVIFSIISDNGELIEENDDLIIENTRLQESIDKCINMNDNQLMTSMRVIGKHGDGYRPCNIPSYYIDRC